MVEPTHPFLKFGTAPGKLFISSNYDQQTYCTTFCVYQDSVKATVCMKIPDTEI